MTRIPTRTLALGAACAVAGVGGGSLIAASAATSPAKPAKAAKAKHRRAGALQRAVHAEATIPTKDGFKDVTLDRGRLVKADGTTLTLTQGGKKTHRTVDVEVPAGAKVIRSKQAADLGDLQTGDRVAVITGLPKGPMVRAMPKR